MIQEEKYQKYSARIEEFQKLPRWSNSDSKSVVLRKKIRAKKNEDYRIKATSYSMHKFSNEIEKIPEIPLEIMSIFPNLTQSSSAFDVISTINESIFNKNQIEICLDYMNSVLLSESPPYFVMLSSGLICQIFTLLKQTKIENIFEKCLKTICNFTICKCEYTEILRKIGVICYFINDFEQELNIQYNCVRLRIIGNLIDCFSGFFEFKECRGFEKIFESHEKWRNDFETTKEILFLLVVVADYFNELDLNELKIVIKTFEIILSLNCSDFISDYLYIIESLCEKINEKFEYVSPRLINFAVSHINSHNSQNLFRVLHIIGNSSCKNQKIFAPDTCIIIFNSVSNINFSADIVPKVLWMIRCMILNSEIAGILYHHGTFEYLCEYLCDPQSKIRRKAVKLFFDFFSSDYFKGSNGIIQNFLISALYQGLTLCTDNSERMGYLEIVEKIVQNSENNYSKYCFESTLLVFEIEDLVFNKNEEISVISQHILEKIQDFSEYDHESIGKTKQLRFN